jgi:hypothetical protein
MAEERVQPLRTENATNRMQRSIKISKKENRIDTSDKLKKMQ